MLLCFITANTKADRIYRTVFTRTENPISEGGNWISGGNAGLDWGNVLTTTGKVFGDQTPNSPPYKDPTAILTGKWGADQWAEGTVYSLHPNESYYQEVEIRLRTSISPHRITGYEIFCRCSKTAAAYVSIVRWNGPLGDFTELVHLDGSRYGVATGDILKATITGNVITGYINGVQVVEARDDTYTTGNPGVGFNYGVGNTNADFGFTSFSASSASKTGNAAFSTVGTTTFCLGENVESGPIAAELTNQWLQGGDGIKKAGQPGCTGLKATTYKYDVNNSFGITLTGLILVNQTAPPVNPEHEAVCYSKAIRTVYTSNQRNSIIFNRKKET